MGTYPLTESQLDRFLLRTEMGYPDRVAERDLLRQHREGLSAVAGVQRGQSIGALDDSAGASTIDRGIVDDKDGHQ